MKISLQDIAERAGVSIKTVSGALHGGNARMAEETRTRILTIASDLGYVTNIAAQGIRKGWLPIVGLIADGLITSPFATDIMRTLDNSLRTGGLSVLVTTLRSEQSVASGLQDIQRFTPKTIAYAAMYHKSVEVPESAAHSLRIMINCRDETRRVPSLIPAERLAGQTITQYLLNKGRRKIAFLNLPGLVAGDLRAEGFREAMRSHDIVCCEDWILPATKISPYSDRAKSLVADHLTRLFSTTDRPDAVLCGNDRIALEVYGVLRRLGCSIPDDVAVASFDNQVEIATRLDPPLTTMALPHRDMGHIAADILLDKRQPKADIEEIPFRLVERASA